MTDKNSNMKVRSIREFLNIRLMWIASFFVCALLLGIIIILVIKSSFLLGQHSLTELLFSSDWNPFKGNFGFLPIILGTLYVTLIAMLISIPVSILSAIYIAEYMRGGMRSILKSFIDVLAGIPSVVYGMCAIIILVPFVRDVLAPLFGIMSTGFCVFTAGIILAIMVFPIIISICVDVFRAVPNEVREVTSALGASKWQTTKLVVLRAGFPGVFSAILLGFGRAFGETMAVAMVVGNLPKTPKSLFDAGATLPSIIASTYGEMMSIPSFDSAMMFMALVLIVIVLFFNYFAKLIKNRYEKRLKG